MTTFKDNSSYIRVEAPLAAEGAKIGTSLPVHFKIEQRHLLVKCAEHHNIHAEVQRALKVIKEEWKLECPSLVVSVTDEANDFLRDNERRLKLKYGLREVFSEGAWVITGGTKTGIVELCEEALKEASFLKQIRDSNENPDVDDNKKKTVLIRIAAEGGVREEPFAEPVDECHDKLIVVDSQNDDPNGEVEFRASLEKALCNKDNWEIGRNIPIVSLVIEGELRTLKTVEAQLKVKTPCAVLSGSGKAANSLSDLLKDHNPNIELSDNQEDKLDSMWCWIKNERSQFLDSLRKILPNKKYLKSFDVDEYLIDDRGNLDAAVLETLLGFDADTNQLLDLAEEWDQPDFVKRTMSAEIIDEIHLEDRLQKAILNQKPEFVKIYDQWKKIESSLDQAGAAAIITDEEDLLLEKYMTQLSENCELPKLFLMSVIRTRPRLTDFYWRKLDNKLAASLVALKVLKDQRHRISVKTDYERHTLLETMIEEYAKKCLGILNACFTGPITQSQNITYDILRLRHQIWKNQSCLELAEGAQFIGFFAEPACYLLVEDIWKEGGDDLQEEKEGRLSNCKSKVFERLSISGKRRFFLHHCNQLVFLSLFSWLLLDGKPPGIEFNKNAQFQSSISYLLTAATVWELLLQFTWIWLFVLENRKKYVKIGIFWNLIILFAYISYLFGLILQHATRNGGLFCYLISLSLHFLRFSRCFFRFQQLGPLMFTIYAMISDIAPFFGILLLFALPYGIAIQALLYPSEFSPLFHIVWGIFFRPLFETLGDSHEDELGAAHFENPGNCSKESGAPWPHNSCPDANYEKTIFVVVLRLIYTLFTNVLLLNILIALFNNRYEKINKLSMNVWRFFAYRVCREYSDRSKLSSLILLIRRAWRFLNHYEKDEHESIWYENREERMARAKMWEKLGSERYLLRDTEKTANQFSSITGVPVSREEKITETFDEEKITETFDNNAYPTLSLSYPIQSYPILPDFSEEIAYPPRYRNFREDSPPRACYPDRRFVIPDFNLEYRRPPSDNSRDQTNISYESITEMVIENNTEV